MTDKMYKIKITIVVFCYLKLVKPIPNNSAIKNTFKSEYLSNKKCIEKSIESNTRILT